MISIFSHEQYHLVFSSAFIFSISRCQPAWWTEMNLWLQEALQDLPCKSPVMICRAFLMDISRDSELSRSVRLKGKAFAGCRHTRIGCCRQLAAWTANIQSPSTESMSLTQGNTWGWYAVQNIRSTVCALRFLPQNQYQPCRMPAGPCMHTPADSGSSQTIWGPRALPYVLAFQISSVLSIKTVFFMNQTLQRPFKASLTLEGMQRHRLKGITVPEVFCKPTVSLMQYVIYRGISTSCSCSLTPLSHESATLPTLPMHNPIFQT